MGINEKEHYETMPSERDAVVIKLRLELIEAMRRMTMNEKEIKEN